MVITYSTVLNDILGIDSARVVVGDDVKVSLIRNKDVSRDITFLVRDAVASNLWNKASTSSLTLSNYALTDDEQGAAGQPPPFQCRGTVHFRTDPYHQRDVAIIPPRGLLPYQHQ